MPFFERFPRIDYAISTPVAGRIQQSVADIFFRLAFFEDIKTNTTIYTEYIVKDGQTPEIIAEIYYGDAEAHWIVLLANDIVDPFYDWVLPYNIFNRYLIEKYGSIETAQETIHHYTKTITRKDLSTDITTEEVLEIDANSAVNPIFSTGFPNIPWDTFDTLAESTFETITFPDGHQVEVTTTREEVSVYDWENEINENKRKIKLIDKAYYPQIMKEFLDFTRDASPTTLRVGFRSPI